MHKKSEIELQISTEDPLVRGALFICDKLRQHGYKAFFAGGCVRDFLLKRQPADIDIATNALPSNIIPLFEKTVQIGAQFGVVAVIRPEGIYQIATFRIDGPYLDGRHPSSVSFADEVSDAQRRDFTINALFLDPESLQVLDFVGGITDLRRGILRAVGTPMIRFQEDRLRMLRAIRFATRFGYTIEPNTFAAIKHLSHRIVETSAERIRDEILKILTEGFARRAIELMDDCGLLIPIFPEIHAMKGVEQPKCFHPEGDVFQHTLLALDYLPQNSPIPLACAVLLHDVGKPGTQTFEDRIRFNLHDKVGARLAEKICKRLRLPKQETQQIVWLVENHMMLSSFNQMREHRRRRLIREKCFNQLVELCRIDALASHGDLTLINDISAYCDRLGSEELRPPRLLTGHDLLSMGYSPGPLFREIFERIESMQLEGSLQTTTEAKVFVLEHYPLDKSPDNTFS